MTGRQVYTAIYIAMLRYGENEATGQQVVNIADECFPASVHRADLVECTYWLGQVRKHLKFLRDPVITRPPTVRQLLQWTVSGPAKRHTYAEYDIPALRQSLEDEGLFRRSSRMVNVGGWKQDAAAASAAM